MQAAKGLRQSFKMIKWITNIYVSITENRSQEKPKGNSQSAGTSNPLSSLGAERRPEKI